MSWKEELTETRAQVKALHAAMPGAAQGFGALSKAVKSEGVLDFKQKEFVALGIAVAIRCEACILFHVEALVKLGASREEVAEVLSMCVQMGGGPGMMYAAKALSVYDELAG
jgi:AhpD family alkylhydroperoxidase